MDATEWTFAKEIVLLDALLAKHPAAEAEVQAVQVGPAVFVTESGGVLLPVRAGSEGPVCIPVHLSGRAGQRLRRLRADRRGAGPHGGGYETRLTSYSNLRPDAGRRLIEAGLELAASMKPGKVPEPAIAPPFQAPWSYGNVPPELS